MKLGVVNVSAENMIGKSKGKLFVEVKSIGEKTAKNAYLALETPSGFKSSALSLSQAQAMPAMPPATQMQMPSAMSMLQSMPFQSS